MSDPRLTSVSSFTTTTHHSIPPSLDPGKVQLPAGFTVCVIGASTGIGEHIAHAYAYAKASNIIIASRTSSDLEDVATKLRLINPAMTVEVAVCDISSAPSVSALAELVSSRYPRLDVVIPNAAYAGPVTLRIDEGQPDWVQRAFDVNVMGTYHVAHYFLPLLLRSDSDSNKSGAKAFIAIGSLAACLRHGPIANTGYAISKFAQTRLVEFLAEQYGGASEGGLLAVGVHPGAVATRMAAGNTPDSFLPYLVDDVSLCGAVCVWISKQTKELHWLNGRLISANWDMDELVAKKDEVVGKDLLKFALVAS